jgi:hypothetical protein
MSLKKAGSARLPQVRRLIPVPPTEPQAHHARLLAALAALALADDHLDLELCVLGIRLPLILAQPSATRRRDILSFTARVLR